MHANDEVALEACDEFVPSGHGAASHEHDRDQDLLPSSARHTPPPEQPQPSELTASSNRSRTKRDEDGRGGGVQAWPMGHPAEFDYTNLKFDYTAPRGHPAESDSTARRPSRLSTAAAGMPRVARASIRSLPFMYFSQCTALIV